MLCDARECRDHIRMARQLAQRSNDRPASLRVGVTDTGQQSLPSSSRTVLTEKSRDLGAYTPERL